MPGRYPGYRRLRDNKRSRPSARGSCAISTDRPLDLFLGDLESHSPLSADDREAILALPARLRKLDPGSYLVREGDKPTHCSILVSGYAFRQKVTGHGSRQIVALCIPGDAIDFQNMFLDISDHSIQILTRAMVVDIPRKALQQLMLQRPAIGAAVIHSTLVEASILREWVINVGRRDARARIAHLLCEFAVRLEARALAPKDGFELPMTQEQLGDATSLTPVHVNRVLKGLQTDGLISRQRRIIHFTDWRALQDTGDFTRRYLHLPGEDEIALAAG